MTTLHITSGDACGQSLAQSGVDGEVFVWHDILYDGPRGRGKSPIPDDATLRARSRYLVDATGGGLGFDMVYDTLKRQYAKLAGIGGEQRVVLWFDACLFDMAMLCHILACSPRRENIELICVDVFPGVEPYHGLGQLTPGQLASVADRAESVKDAQFAFAARVDRAFALQDKAELALLAAMADAPLPWIPTAAARWLAEQPDAATGLGRLETLALDAIRAGRTDPRAIFTAVAAADDPPQYWGDSTLWQKINGLAAHKPPLVKIEGPAARLPQWETLGDVGAFRVEAVTA